VLFLEFLFAASLLHITFVLFGWCVPDTVADSCCPLPGGLFFPFMRVFLVMGCCECLSRTVLLVSLTPPRSCHTVSNRLTLFPKQCPDILLFTKAQFCFRQPTHQTPPKTPMCEPLYFFSLPSTVKALVSSRAGFLNGNASLVSLSFTSFFPPV